MKAVMKTWAQILLFAAVVTLARAEPGEKRFSGGSFDGWDRDAMTNALVLGGALVRLSSGADQTFDFTAVSRPLAAVTLSAEAPEGTITNNGTMRLCLPTDWACRFDTDAEVSFSGGAAPKVGAERYEDDDRTLVIPVTGLFVAGDILVVSGLRLANLLRVPPDTRRLELDFDGDGARDKYDDYRLTVRALWPGGSYDGWDRDATVESASLESQAKGTVILIR